MFVTQHRRFFMPFSDFMFFAFLATSFPFPICLDNGRPRIALDVDLSETIKPAPHIHVRIFWQRRTTSKKKNDRAKKNRTENHSEFTALSSTPLLFLFSFSLAIFRRARESTRCLKEMLKQFPASSSYYFWYQLELGHKPQVYNFFSRRVVLWRCIACCYWRIPLLLLLLLFLLLLYILHEIHMSV